MANTVNSMRTKNKNIRGGAALAALAFALAFLVSFSFAFADTSRAPRAAGDPRRGAGGSMSATLPVVPPPVSSTPSPTGTGGAGNNGGASSGNGGNGGDGGRGGGGGGG